ncbi:MAG: SDR family NAD(P)-dependent oxidoreductase [Deltaproteobacteria bacterium]|jgi:NAD(P)-dependent dehydrogenase (short-subunit alcohol dehydrogenase family)|nr:SDR family NAD(P)-dependent oxidoreductase [Deltaproteobacteria bacterium]
MKEMRGRVAVITGAASGIGRGMAEAFAGAEMKVMLSDVRAEALDAAAKALRDQGATVESVVADVRDPDAVQRLADRTLETFGSVHVVCNNAGIASSSSLLWEAPLEEWDWHLGVMVMGAVHGIRSFVPILLEQGDEGHVVNTASMGGLITGSHAEAVYMTAKHAVVALTEGLQDQLASVSDRVKCSVLCPAFVTSNVYDSYEELRPGRVKSHLGTEEGRQMVAGMKHFLDSGMPAREAGEIVLQAIHDERFYILTHPEWASMVEGRMRGILDGTDPQRPAPPLGAMS